MIVLSWNCRGLGQSRAVRVLDGLMKAHRPNVVFLMETLVQKQKIEEIRVKLKFEGGFAVDAEGRSGGLCVFWKTGCMVNILGFSRNCINMNLTCGDEEFRLTGFYGVPDRSRRAESWNLLRSLAGQDAWCCIGDFNDLLHASEKKGQNPHPQNLMDGFRRAVDDCGLVDIPLEGYPFTWWRSRGQPTAVEERLDRAMVNESWSDLFPLATLTNHVASVSDHSPIVLNTKDSEERAAGRGFRFENTWLHSQELKQLVIDKWQVGGMESVGDKLESCIHFMKIWSKDQKRGYGRQLAIERRKLEELRSRDDEASARSFQVCRNHINALLAREEGYWKQRAKQFWFKEGDLNTTFFHRAANGRRKHKALSRLQWSHGAWEDDDIGMGRVAIDYFTTLFSAGDSVVEPIIETVHSRVTGAHNASLLAPFTDEEFRIACCAMHPDKAPGPDGLNPAFFQSFWEVMGKEIANDCRSWLAEKSIPVGVRATNIVLLPKKDNPTRMTDLRPISLCNVRYRILAKVLANRLRGIMADIIPEEQSAFIHGRSIVDNVLIAVETLHALNLRRSAKVGEVALKVDISKAFDRVEWRYLESIMLKLGFDPRWVELMMLCVRSVEYSVLINTHKTESFIPERGLRQGCPLSPFLFIICAEGLSAMIRRESDLGNIHGVRVCRGAPLVSHLLFADDSFFFFRAEFEEARRMRLLFDKYANASGQLINFDKSAIFFSKSTHAMLQDGISHVLGVHVPFDRGKYLGMPSVVGRNKRVAFQYVLDRVWERIQKWKGRWLSMGGKEVLVKAVLQAIPTYCMNVFVLPNTMIIELERMLNSFWWGTKNSGGQGISWMRWERLCVKKDDGGMGFKDLHAFNLAMVGKQGWKFLTEPNALVTKIFKAKYFPRGDFLSATLRGSPSFAWHSIWKSQELIRQGYRWRVGDGRSIGVWSEPWLKRNGQLRVASAPIPGLENLKVEDLWIPGFRCWDEELLEDIFAPDDVAAILEVNTLVGGGNDSRLWHYNKTGEYSVKSAYKVYMEYMVDRASLTSTGSWRVLWNQRLPPKVNHFLWRLGRGILPLRSTLRHRHINVPLECGLCNTGSEDELHLFTGCCKTKDIWREAGLLGKIENMAGHNSFGEWLEGFFQQWSAEERIKGAIVMWSVWGERNQIVWNHESRTARLVVEGGMTMLNEWRAARGLVGQSQTQGGRREAVCERWHPPDELQLKCNVDAAFRVSTRDWGWGAAVRDHYGTLLSYRTGWLRGTPEVREGEAMALLDALLWIQASGEENMEFETDSSDVAAAVMGHNDDHTEFGNIVKQCRLILQLKPGFTVKGVRRNRNIVAHELAQRSFSFASPTVGHVSPFWLESALTIMCTDIDH